MKSKPDFCHNAPCIPTGSGVPLDVMVYWCGHQRTSETSYRWNGMNRGSHPLVLWQYTIAGCGALEINNEIKYIRPGEAFLLTIPEKHIYYRPENPGFWEFLFISIQGNESLRIASELRKISGDVSRNYATAATVDLAWEIIRTNMENRALSGTNASKQAYEFMMSLVNGCNSRNDSCAHSIIRQIHLYLLANLHREISLEDMADFTGFSRSHFCRIFKEHTGCTPHEYLLSLRMDMALRKLQNENLSVKEAAAACGFMDCGYFCKVFRKYHGAAPGCFKRNRKY